MNETNRVDLQTCFVTNPNMVLRMEEDDCAILFDPDAGQVRILNTTAAAVWELIDGQRTVAEILAALRERFEGVDTESENQVLRLLDDFQGFGALAIAGEASI